MDTWKAMLGNQVLVSAVVGWTVAQVLKTLIDFALNKSFNAERLVGSGGMPSSHSAIVTGLATLIGKYEGVDTPIFALALIVAFVVMYDACGVRRAAGKQAALLNKIVETPGLSGVQVSERLVEVLGHTPTQVVVGALIGVIVGLIA